MEYEKKQAEKGQQLDKEGLYKFVTRNYILSSWFSITLLRRFLDFLDSVRTGDISLEPASRDEFVKTALKSVLDDLPETIIGQAMDPEHKGQDLDIADCTYCPDKECRHRGSAERRPRWKGDAGLCPYLMAYAMQKAEER